MEENINTDCTCKEPISAFAFNTAKALEAFINNHNQGLILEHKMLQAKVLDFYAKYKNADDYDIGPFLIDKFKTTFGIKEDTHGNI